MATIYTEKYNAELFGPIVDNYIDRAADDKADDILKRLSKRKGTEFINKCLNDAIPASEMGKISNSHEWTIKWACFNCSERGQFKHPPSTTLTSIIDFYTTFLCPRCNYINRDRYPNGRHSVGYTFSGLVEIIDSYGTVIHTIDSSSRSGHNSTSADNNIDNIYISIWDDPPKKAKMNKMIARIIEDSDISDDDYCDDGDDFV